MIVVTGPTGQIGRYVVANLLAADIPMRVIARDATKLPPGLGDRAEIVEGSHGDETVVSRAFDGADAVFWVVPPTPSLTLDQVYLDFTRPAAAAISRHGVKRVVAITALGRGTRWARIAGLVTASINMDEMLMATGAAFRGLAMPSFMENLLRQAPTIKADGLFFGPIEPNKKLPATAARDAGAVAARLLAETWTGQEDHPVLGPEDLSSNEMAAIISSVLGREVRYQQITLSQLKEQLVDRGASESFAQGYVDMMRAKNEGMDNVADRTPASRTPTSFRQWTEDTLKPVVLSR